jgi:xanthine dehydrogenase iron-sulfur cluster and FAD-binding subunit A
MDIPLPANVQRCRSAAVYHRLALSRQRSPSVTVLAPTRLDDAVAALAADPSLTVLAGGTDLMVAVNYGQYRPGGVLSLRRVPELHDWHVEG